MSRTWHIIVSVCSDLLNLSRHSLLRSLLLPFIFSVVCTKPGRQVDRQADRQADRQTDRQAERQTDRQAGRQTGRQKGGLVDRQAGRQD